MIRVEQTVEFQRWTRKLKDREAKRRIASAISKLAFGLGTVKALGGGISEVKLTYGPGYRLYFARRGDTLIILLIGGDKSSQSADIETARALAKGL